MIKQIVDYLYNITLPRKKKKKKNSLLIHSSKIMNSKTHELSDNIQM